MSKKDKKITASDARELLLKAWTECEFGIKERVKKFHSHRTIQYILETETYSKVDVILNVIETIKAQSEAVKSEAVEMNDKIQKVLN